MNINTWLTETVTVSQIIGRGGGGDPIYGPQVTMKARIERSVRLRIGVDNLLQDVHRMITKEAVTVGARVWFPGDNPERTNAARRPLAVQTAGNKSDTYRFYESLFAG